MFGIDTTLQPLSYLANFYVHIDMYLYLHNIITNCLIEYIAVIIHSVTIICNVYDATEHTYHYEVHDHLSDFKRKKMHNMGGR